MAQTARSGPHSPVVIVGAGPVGLALAVGLSRHGVRSLILERKSTTSRTSKAPGLHVRTREIFRQWGIEERFLEAGTLLQPLTLHSAIPGHRPLLALDFSELSVEADRPGLLLLEQEETERLLLDVARESGLCEVRFGAEVVDLAQDARAVRLTYRHQDAEHTHLAEFAVGCDGAGSFVREALGLPFPGATYGLRPLLADIRIDDARDDLPQPRTWTGAGALRFAARLRPGLWRLVHLPKGEPEREDVGEEEIADHVRQLLGRGPFELVWASRFRIHIRASPRFRVGRVLLAGDAAHVHSPASGFGLNGGVHDAHNLAWKLAAALEGGDTDRLLDSYDVERRAVVVEDTSRYTDRITRLFIESPALVREAAWVAVRTALRMGRIRRRGLRRTAMIDLDYPASPLLRRRARGRGVRLPNPLLRSPDGRAVRLYELLPNEPVLLEVAEDPGFRLDSDLPVRRLIRIGPQGFEEPTGLLRKLLGRRDGWILVRPDTHVAWARHTRKGMEEAVRHALGGAPPGGGGAGSGHRLAASDADQLQERERVAGRGHSVP